MVLSKKKQRRDVHFFSVCCVEYESTKNIYYLIEFQIKKGEEF